MRRAWALGLGILFLSLVAAPADAKLPKYKTGKGSIVPGKSLGGVSVGMTKARAKTTWGVPDQCHTSGGVTDCRYTLPASFGTDYVAAFYLKKGRVVAVQAEAPESGRPLAKTRKMKTSKGIHIGSRMSEARNKYDIKPTGLGEANESRAQIKKGKKCTTFYAPEEPYTVISSITVGICKSVIELY